MSPIFNIRYIPSKSGKNLASGARKSIIDFRPKDAITRICSNITTGYATAIADVKNNSGSIGVFHNGCTLEGAISIRAPSSDWCRHDETIPTITTNSITLLTAWFANLRTLSTGLFRTLRIPVYEVLPTNLSATIGIHSTYKTVVEIIRHIATAKRIEVKFQFIRGLVRFQYRPTSVKRARMTNVYPKRATRRAGLIIKWKCFLLST